MNTLIGHLAYSGISNYLDIRAKGIPHRVNYATCLPNEVIQHIFTFLPLEDQTSTSLARVSYQFYINSMHIREKFNCDLTQICKQISEVVMSSFHRMSTPTIFGVHYDFTEEQRFFVDVDYVYNQNTSLTTIQCKIVKQVVDDDNVDTVDRVLDVSNLNLKDSNFVLVDNIECRQGFLLTTTQSSKIKLIAGPGLKKELQIVASRAVDIINKSRK